VGRGAATITWGSGSSPTPINTSPQLQPTPTPALPSTPAPIGGSSSTAPYTAPPAAAQTGPPRLEARLTNAGPTSAAVGEYVSFELTVTNRGESTARNILVYDRFDVGLSHDGDTAVPKRNAIEYRAMRDLPPGETATVPLTFKVLAAGQHCHEATVSADGATPVTQSGCVTGRQAALQVRLDAVRRQVVSQPAGFTITVRNVGDVPATNIEIIQQFAPSLQAMPAAPEQQLAADGSLRIRIDRLNANEVRQFNTQARCVTPSASAASRATVTADGGAPQQDEAFVEIVP
jgi:uncharacterized repeat protein (TIGR01451 family)